MNKNCKYCKKIMIKPRWRSKKQWEKIKVHKKCMGEYYHPIELGVL